MSDVPEEKKNMQRIATTFFRVNRVNIRSGEKVHRYKFELSKIMGERDGEEAGKREVKTEMKRVMIQNILHGAPPDAATWVTDYISDIISIGKLYKHFSDEVGKEWPVSHHCQPPFGTSWTPAESVIRYEGLLDVLKLNDFIDLNMSRDPDYSPKEDLRALNLLSWKHIYDMRKPAGPIFTIGKTFYRDDKLNHASQLLSGSDRESKESRLAICDVKRGFWGLWTWECGL